MPFKRYYLVFKNEDFRVLSDHVVEVRFLCIAAELFKCRSTNLMISSACRVQKRSVFGEQAEIEEEARSVTSLLVFREKLLVYSLTI